MQAKKTEQKNIAKLKTRINNASCKSARDPAQITLLAASKTQTAERIREAFMAEITSFGENYLQEALEKQEKLKDLPIDWHFIGTVQRRKCKAIAQHFNWVHSVDSLKIVEALNQHRPQDLPAMNICIQVNLDQEASKSGVLLEDVESLVEKIKIMHLPNIKLRGLMAIPAPRETKDEQLAVLLKLKTCYDQLREQGYDIDTLSMGMSQDLEAAIEAGSTIIRIGTAIFGPREKA